MIRKATGAGNFKFKAETTDVRFSDVAGINEEREQLKKVASSIIFIDEIDAVAQNRYSGKSYLIVSKR